MAKPAEVLKALESQLKNSAILDYVKDAQIFLGARDGIATFPSICIERENLEEQNGVYPIAELRMAVQLIMLTRNENKNYQLAGENGARGTLDLENDVKQAIDADLTLGGIANNIEIQDSADGIEEYPVRSVNLRIIIWFRQLKGDRN